jgi:hypothetical protein
MTSGSRLVAGTTSDAGKSMLTAGAADAREYWSDQPAGLLRTCLACGPVRADPPAERLRLRRFTRSRIPLGPIIGLCGRSVT